MNNIHVFPTSHYVNVAHESHPFPVPGPPGPQGERGPQGPAGERGSDGEPGVEGSPGIQGELGPAGPPGADSTVPGPAGEASYAILSDQFAFVVPQPGSNQLAWCTKTTPFSVGMLVTVGDAGYYRIDRLAGPGMAQLIVQNLGLPENASPGTVVPPGALILAVGARGAQGEEGPIGPQGPEGLQGSVGPAGPIGPEGPQGEQGEQGPEGRPGAWEFFQMDPGWLGTLRLRRDAGTGAQLDGIVVAELPANAQAQIGTLAPAFRPIGAARNFIVMVNSGISGSWATLEILADGRILIRPAVAMTSAVICVSYPLD